RAAAARRRPPRASDGGDRPRTDRDRHRHLLVVLRAGPRPDRRHLLHGHDHDHHRLRRHPHPRPPPTLFPLIPAPLISARLTRVLGANIPRGLHDHVVVCGLGNIGYRMVEQLHGLGVPLVAAELHEPNRYLPAVRRLGVPVLVADIRLPETLEVLHVGRARSVVVVTSSDIVNLETALNIQALNPDIRVVLRLFDPDLAARVERAFGFHISRSPSALAAPAFAAAAAGEHVL